MLIIQYTHGEFKTGGGMLKLDPIYPRYVGPRLIIPGVHWMGGMLDLLHRAGYNNYSCGYCKPFCMVACIMWSEVFYFSR